MSALTPTTTTPPPHTTANSHSLSSGGAAISFGRATRKGGGAKGPGGQDLCVFEGGADAATALAPAYASMVCEGPGGGVGGGERRGGAGVGVSVGVGVDDVAREQRVVWRQRRQRALLVVGQVSVCVCLCVGGWVRVCGCGCVSVYF